MAHLVAAMACNRLRLLQRTIAARSGTPKVPTFAFSNYCSWPRTNHGSPFSYVSSLSSLHSLTLPLKNQKEVNYKVLFGLGNPKAENPQLPEEISDSHCAGSSKGWLAFVNRRDCQIYMAHLFCPSSSVSSKIVPLPSVTTLTGVVGVFLDSYSSPSLQHFLEFGDVTEPPTEKSPERMSGSVIRRLAMSSTPMLNDGDDYDRNCVIMISRCAGRQLAFCRIGDSSWRTLDGAQALDIAYSKKNKLFYSLNTCTDYLEIKAWDFKNASFPTMVDVFNFACGDIPRQEFTQKTCRFSSHHLMESPEGDILLLRRYVNSIDEEKDKSPIASPHEFHVDSLHSYRTLSFDVYKLNFEKRSAEPVESLGDTALFVGFNEAFSLSTRDHPELTPHSVYFADHNGEDMSLYKVKVNERSVTPLQPPSWFKLKKIQPPPIWVSSS